MGAGVRGREPWSACFHVKGEDILQHPNPKTKNESFGVRNPSILTPVVGFPKYRLTLYPGTGFRLGE